MTVSEGGAVLAGTPPTEAVFAAGSATADLGVATEDDEVAGDGSVVTVSLVAGTGYTVDANASEATMTVEDDDGAAENAAPTGLPTIAGTAQVGETLTASAADIADADGFANATFAWQWIANDGTADADIAGATGTSYTLTAAEVGKTVKVRVVFTDDGGTEEMMVSEASAAVAAALPVVSVGAAAPPVTEGAAVEFTLSRTGDAASALTVAVSVSEDGAVLSGTPASAVTFGAGSDEATLSVATDDDSVAEADGRVTASVGAGGEAGGPSWAAWGRFATSGFQGEEADLSLSGDVTTGFLGADVSLERGLAGLAVGVSEGEGSFDNGAGDGGGTVQSSLTSVFPYARLAIGDGLDIWGLVGVGSGDLTLAVGEEMTRTDLSMRMGALELRGEIVTAEEEGDFGLAWKSDALWVRTESAASRSSTGGNLEAASGDVSRVRVTMEGSRAFAAGPGSAVTPTLEIGLRHDGGDAETGAGVEAGFGLEYSNPAQGLTVEGRVRGLLAHTDGAYEEWGASGSLRLDPGISGRGVSLTVAPVWGAASGGVEQLWSTGTAAGLAADDAFDAQARLQAELGYGLRPPVGQGVLTPYAGFTAAGDGVGRTYRLGAR